MEIGPQQCREVRRVVGGPHSERGQGIKTTAHGRAHRQGDVCVLEDCGQEAVLSLRADVSIGGRPLNLTAQRSSLTEVLTYAARASRPASRRIEWRLLLQGLYKHLQV